LLQRPGRSHATLDAADSGFCRQSAGALTIFTINWIIKVVNWTDVYRLEALLELAQAYPASLTAAEVARRREIPAAFLARLLGEVAREELVATTRGPRGGVRLATPPEAITVGQLLAPDAVRQTGGPAVRWLAARLTEARQGVLARLTLAELVRVERELDATPSFDI
jgi:Rrf2 family protein